MHLCKVFATCLLLGVAALHFAPAECAAQAATGPDTSPPAGVLQPGDIIRLRIWREPDLSGDFPVDQTGVVTFPKLGPLKVTAESAETLRQQLISGYQEFLRNPSVEVILLRRVNVLGAVKNPGLYPVDATMTISDALALAGGATPDGNRKEIQLLRRGERVLIRLDDQTRIVDLPLRSGDQLFVPERRWISRNPGIIAASISALTSVIIALVLR